MSKCVVSGYIGFDNFGDEAIASVLVEKLKKEGFDKITLISANPNKTANLYGVKSCGMLNFFPAIIKCDRLISGGGSLLQDVTSFKSLIYYLCVIYTALFFNKKVEIFAQGIGPINSKLGQTLTKFALKNADKITVRDKKSQDLLNSWGINSELVKDPIFDLQTDTNIIKQNIVGVQLRSFKGVTDEFLNHLANQIRIKFPNERIEVLSLQDSMDLKICQKFANLVNGSVISNMTVKDVIQKISSLKYLVAMRFHACVIAIKSSVEVIAINYDPKVQKLAEEYKLNLINLNDSNFIL